VESEPNICETWAVLHDADIPVGRSVSGLIEAIEEGEAEAPNAFEAISAGSAQSLQPRFTPLHPVASTYRNGGALDGMVAASYGKGC